jgi:hypothetical protein
LKVRKQSKQQFYLRISTFKCLKTRVSVDDTPPVTRCFFRASNFLHPNKLEHIHEAPQAGLINLSLIDIFKEKTHKGFVVTEKIIVRMIRLIVEL